MKEPDPDPTELQLFGLPSLVLATVAGIGIFYAVVRLVTVALPMARWMAFAPPE